MWQPTVGVSEHRVIVRRVRPTWAARLPERTDEDSSPLATPSHPMSPLEDTFAGPTRQEHFHIFAKVMLLGDSGVGKTCLLVRFRHGTFQSGNYISTVGIDFRNKTVLVDDTKVKLQIWDTAGQERFRSVTHAYYRDAQALLLLYDVTNKASFDNIRAWLAEIREYAQEDVVIMLLGNKCDSDAEAGGSRQVRREEGERLAREHDVPFLETSAASGANVERAFAGVARALRDRHARRDDRVRFTVRDFERAQRPPSCPPCTA